MINISHRGNVCGPNTFNFDNQAQIVSSFDVELDVWDIVFSNLGVCALIGHERDSAKLHVLEKDFKFDRVWFHAKTMDVYRKLYDYSPDYPYKFFAHDKDICASVLYYGRFFCNWFAPKLNIDNYKYVVSNSVIMVDNPITEQEFLCNWIKNSNKIIGVCSDAPRLVSKIIHG